MAADRFKQNDVFLELGLSIHISILRSVFQHFIILEKKPRYVKNFGCW